MENSPLSQQNADYVDWLRLLKSRVRQIQLKAAVSVNRAVCSCIKLKAAFGQIDLMSAR